MANNVSELMPIIGIDDWEMRIRRQDAFWERAILDRPVISISFPKESGAKTGYSPRKYPSPRDAWLDAEACAMRALHTVENTEYFGDALPTACPNLGPEVVSAFFGMEMDFSETTSWGIPNLQDWRDADKIRFSEDNFYWRKLMEFTDAFLAVGKERFHTGLTDFHPGADALAAFRDPLHLNMDLFDHPEEVKALRARVDSDYFRIFDQCYRKLAVENRQAVTSWAGVVSSKLWYVPSNDFSCMISSDMFREFFLDGLAEECRFYTNSLYHLDGPDALRHLDALLEIPELNAIQWVYGAGNGRATDWLDVYRKCQKAGKGVQLFPQADEVDTIIGSLRPEGAWCCIHGIRNRAEAEAILRKFEKWV